MARHKEPKYRFKDAHLEALHNGALELAKWKPGPPRPPRPLGDPVTEAAARLCRSMDDRGWADLNDIERRYYREMVIETLAAARQGRREREHQNAAKGTSAGTARAAGKPGAG